MRRHREEKGRLQIVGDALRKENEGRKEVLLVAAARLWGERVASRIMEQLQRDAGEDVAPCAGKTDVGSKTVAALGLVGSNKSKEEATQSIQRRKHRDPRRKW